MTHTIWIDEEPDGFAVRCIPHGEIGWTASHLAAFILGAEHDHENGTWNP